MPDPKKSLDANAAPGGDHDDEAGRFAQAILATMRQPLLVLSGDLRVETANRAFYQTFEIDEADTRGRLVYELGNGPNNGTVEEFKVEHDSSESAGA